MGEAFHLAYLLQILILINIFLGISKNYLYLLYLLKPVQTQVFFDSKTQIKSLKNIGFRTNNLAELSTAEAMSFDSTHGRLVMSSVGKFNQQYVAQRKAGQADHNHEVGPVKFISGSTMISICNDDNPSLLVELNKSKVVPILKDNVLISLL